MAAGSLIYVGKSRLRREQKARNQQKRKAKHNGSSRRNSSGSSGSSGNSSGSGNSSSSGSGSSCSSGSSSPVIRRRSPGFLIGGSGYARLPPTPLDPPHPDGEKAEKKKKKKKKNKKNVEQAAAADETHHCRFCDGLPDVSTPDCLFFHGSTSGSDCDDLLPLILPEISLRPHTKMPFGSLRNLFDDKEKKAASPPPRPLAGPPKLNVPKKTYATAIIQTDALEDEDVFRPVSKEHLEAPVPEPVSAAAGPDGEEDRPEGTDRQEAEEEVLMVIWPPKKEKKEQSGKKEKKKCWMDDDLKKHDHVCCNLM